jgi:hypothetical protein
MERRQTADTKIPHMNEVSCGAIDLEPENAMRDVHGLTSNVNLKNVCDRTILGLLHTNVCTRRSMNPLGY